MLDNCTNGAQTAYINNPKGRKLHKLAKILHTVNSPQIPKLYQSTTFAVIKKNNFQTATYTQVEGVKRPRTKKIIIKCDIPQQRF